MLDRTCTDTYMPINTQTHTHTLLKQSVFTIQHARPQFTHPDTHAQTNTHLLAPLKHVVPGHHDTCCADMCHNRTARKKEANSIIPLPLLLFPPLTQLKNSREKNAGFSVPLQYMPESCFWNRQRECVWGWTESVRAGQELRSHIHRICL